jgi:hypothetical protein
LSLLLKIAARFDPREPRTAVNIASTIVAPDNRVIPVQIINLSRMGFTARVSVALKPDIWVGIELPGHGIMPTRIRWFDDGLAGGKFRKPINLDRLQRSTPDWSHGLFRTRIVQPPL